MHNGLCKCLTGLAFFKSGIPLVWLISSYYAYIHLIARCLLGRGVSTFVRDYINQCGGTKYQSSSGQNGALANGAEVDGCIAKKLQIEGRW